MQTMQTLMQTLAWQSLDRFAECLDFFRSRLLRTTLKLTWLRPLFYTRSWRLAFLFTLALMSSLTLSIFFPLWLLLFGPLLYGVPHIVASLRYFHHSVADSHLLDSSDSSRTRAASFGMASTILVLVFAYRLFISLNILNLNVAHLSEWKGSTYIDLMALSLTFVAGALIYKKSRAQLIRGFALLLPFGAAFWLRPTWTIGAMVLIHNFVAFAYWIRSTSTRSERWVACIAFVTVLAISAAVFMGAFDGLYAIHSPMTELDLARLSTEDTGRLIAPWANWESDNALGQLFWLRLCSIFAFGQALHYFVWLKAIPDQFHYHDVPTSFRQSLQLMGQDFGKMAAAILIVLCAISVAIWSMMSFQEARMIYFCLAGYHGYLEIAGLALASGFTREPNPLKRPSLLPTNP